MSSKSSRPGLLVFYDKDNARYAQKVVEDLSLAYAFLSVAVGGELNPYQGAYDARRGQLSGQYLLDQLRIAHGRGLALWLVCGDAYDDALNFIFGLAGGQEAVVSTYRLDSDELVAKEAIHEAGHLLGLGHCRYPCVMRFSNTLVEARHKPKYLCARCRQQITDEQAQ